MANLKGHEGGVNALAFSETVHYMASAGEDGYARLWDLRKLTNFDNLSIGDGGAAHSVAFDFSGSYLAAGGNKCTKVCVCVCVCMCVCSSCVTCGLRSVLAGEAHQGRTCLMSVTCGVRFGVCWQQ